MNSHLLFRSITTRPWPYIVIIPCILIVFTAVGWTRDDIIEEEVYNIWTPTSSEFAKDKEYLASLNSLESTISTFAAMAIARDGGNLFTESRLEEIRVRMEQVEATTIEYKGETFSWQDMCSTNSVGLGTTYQFPCIRLSMMDLFQEARWYFTEEERVTWYTEVIRKLLIKPRVPRFGILTQICTSGSPLSQSSDCDRTVALRTNETFAVEEGFSADYANPLLLLSDVGGLEMNDQCKICVEEKFEATMERLTAGTTGLFGVMLLELLRLLESGTVTDVDELAKLQRLIEQVGTLEKTVDRAAVEEWYSYYVVRGLYADLGSGSYVETYAGVMELLNLPCLVVTGNATMCPATVTEEEAKVHLANHADNAFSSVTTAGAPFPFWSNGDGTGELFGGTFPVSGSGIDMSGTVLSAAAYLDIENYMSPAWKPLYEGFIDPLTPGSNWTNFVETDPIFRWHLAGVTPMASHCGNGNLTGTNLAEDPFAINSQTADGLANASRMWCTEYSIPNEIEGNETQQHFAKMFYDLLVDSPSFMDITQGESDPYDWTNGNGCGYNLGGVRTPYTNMSEASILYNASRVLYNVDEGVSTGAIDRNFLMGGVTPAIEDYNYDNPLQQVRVIQTVYPALGRLRIPDRVKNCNRPGGPVNITDDEAKELLEKFKETFEKVWTVGWDDPDAGEVQFVGFFDDQGGTIGTTGRILRDITLDNGTLTTISIAVIAVISAVFLFSFDVVQSKVLVTLIGVSLVVLSFFAALGFGIICGIKINVNIAWTLPFIILGLGVDDMYIVLLALRNRRSYTPDTFIETMTEVLVPVTMTSLVNASMFAVMNLVDVPAVYLTARMALISVIFLYFTVVVSFPAYCYLDMKRQAAGRYDVLVCLKKPEASAEDETDMHKDSFLYTSVYKKLVLGKGVLTVIVRAVVILAVGALLGIGSYGVSQREVGLGLEDFFPTFTQAHIWAVETTKTLGSWGIEVRWGEANYTDPDTQLFIMRQFEQVIETPYVAELDTKFLWLAGFNVWMTRHCKSNFDREDPNVLECGMDQIFPGDNTTCSGSWLPNTYNAREKDFGNGEQCVVFEGGVCRPASQMHPKDQLELGIDTTNPEDSSWCPIFKDFSEDKLQFCLMKWHNFTGGGGRLLKEEGTETPNPACQGEFYNDAIIETPIRLSGSSPIFTFGLYEHEDFLTMIEQTRAVCDNVDRLRCWVGGIPQNYWEQYLTIEWTLLQASAAAIGVGFLVAFVFILATLKKDDEHPNKKILLCSFLGALLIAITCIISLVSVVGISVLLGVSVTAFSGMSFLLSVGFAIEYSVHIVHRYIKAPLSLNSPAERVGYAMSFLTLPTFLSFVSSSVGVVCLAFTDFEFNEVFFFRPLITVMFVTYFVGCWFLPVLLTFLNIDALKCGSIELEADELPVEPEMPLKNENASA